MGVIFIPPLYPNLHSLLRLVHLLHWFGRMANRNNFFPNLNILNDRTAATGRKARALSSYRVEGGEGKGCVRRKSLIDLLVDHVTSISPPLMPLLKS